MITVNQVQIKNLFNDETQMHKLYMYKIVNFNNETDTIVSENTNNFLQLQFVKMLEGAYITTSISPQIKVLNEVTQDVGLKTNTDYVFATNDSLKELENTKDTYVFTLNQDFDKNPNVYFIGDNSIKAFNQLDSDDLGDMRLDDEASLIDLWSVSLQSIEKMQIGKNAKITFQLIDYLPKIEKINHIEYEVPINSCIQTIQVVGSIKNDALGIELNDGEIPMELYSSNGVLPIVIDYTNLKEKANFYIKSFNLSYQIPLFTIERILLKEDLEIVDVESIFRATLPTDEDLPDSIKDLIILYKNIVQISWAYSTNFKNFDKNNELFQKYFNATYANLSALEFNTNLIYEYHTKYPNVTDSIQFQVFQSLLLATSERIYSPFCWSGGGVQEYKDALWYFLEVKVFANSKEQWGFNDDGSINNGLLPKIDLNFKSHFFNVKISGIEGGKKYFFEIINKDFSSLKKNKNTTSLISLPYLPSKISEIYNNKAVADYDPKSNDSFKYLTYIFFNDSTTLTNFIKNYFQASKITPLFKQAFSDTNPTRFPTVEEVQKLLPPGAINIRVSEKTEDLPNPIIQEKVKGEIQWLDCIGYPSPPSCIEARNPNPNENQSLCYITKYKYQEYPIRVCTNSVESRYNTARPFKQTEVFQTTVYFDYDINIPENNNNYLTSEFNLQILLTYNNLNKNTNILKFTLNKEYQKDGWYISKIKEDQHYSLINSARNTKINYDGKINSADGEVEVNNQDLPFSINNSYQNMDNTITLTKNKY